MKLKFRIIKNKNNRPYKKSIKYGDTIVLHVPDYLEDAIVKSIVSSLNKGDALKLDW